MVAICALVAAGAAAFVLVWFQPQKLVIDKTVREAAPVPTASPAPSASDRATSFRSLEHHTTGVVRLVAVDGGYIVRIDDLDTSNGPDLRVILSPLPSDRGLRDYGRGFVDLGALKGNRGSQNYRVPAGVDPTRYASVVIWCRRFTVGFGVAPLART